MRKIDMLREMDANLWGHDTDMNSTYDEVKEEYDEMCKEFSDDSVMFPNGRDYDAENFDD